jgi:mRNA-degrading endonuclease toxin of MazEF toxin-antitoxin module
MAEGESLKDGLKRVRPVRPGEVYWADDSQVSQNLKAALGMVLKDARPVVVVQAVPNQPKNAGLVLVCPLTTGDRRTHLDVIKPPGEAGLAEASVIQTPLVFPIPKDALNRFAGTLSPQTLALVQARLGQLLGLISVS